MLKLVKPAIKYKKSYLAALKEFQKEGRNLNINYNDVKNNFKVFTNKLKNRARGEDLPKGYVPDTVLWLVDGNKFLGKIAIRHNINTKKLKLISGHVGYEIAPSERKKGYGTKQLQLALPFAEKLGLKKLLISCNEDNIGSQKIIEHCSGKFEKKIFDSEEKNYKLRYWIQIN